MTAKLSLISVFLIFTTAANAGILPSPKTFHKLGGSSDESFEDTIDWVDDFPKNMIETIDHTRYVVQEHVDTSKQPVDDNSVPLGHPSDTTGEEMIAAFNLKISDKVVGYPEDISSEEDEDENSPLAYAQTSMIYNEESVAPVIDYYTGELGKGNPQGKIEIVSLQLLLKELLEMRDGLIHNKSK